MSSFLFIKAQALGNDFVILHAADLPEKTKLFLTPERIRLLADRRYGIGYDQLIVYEKKPSFDQNHWNVLFFNADGSAAEACGNGSRCLVLLLADAHANDTYLHTPGGILQGRCLPQTGEQPNIQLIFPKPKIIDTHPPLFTLSNSPLLHVCVGNPHLVLRLPHPPTQEIVTTHGPLLESAIPGGANVSFAYISPNSQSKSTQEITLNVWERGVGFTPACGTAACAVAAAVHHNQQMEGSITIQQPGGVLGITVHDTTLTMTGAGSLVYSGHFWYGLDLEARL